MDVCALILAAGEDKGMHSDRSRFVHDVCGKPMIQWLSLALENAGAKDQLYVVGYQQEQVRHALGEDKIYVLQENQLGTGHAVLMGSSFLESRSGCTLVLPGDAPLLQSKTIIDLLRYFERNRPASLIVTAETRTPGPASEVVRSAAGEVEYLSEPFTDEFAQASYHEIDTGIYCFDTALLLSFMGQLDWQNSGTMRIPTIINKMIADGRKLMTYKIPYEESIGVENRVQLETVRRRMNRRICEQHMLKGVTIENPDACYIEADVVLEKDVHVSSGCRLSGNTHVHARTYLGPRCFLHHATIGQDCHLGSGNFFECSIDDEVKIGFNANLHENVHVAYRAKVRDNVELCDCRIGKLCEIDSQTFLSTCELGESSFIGRGVITVDPLHLAAITEPKEAQEKIYSQIGAGAEIGALSRLFRPFVIAEKTDLPPGSIIKQSKRSLFTWGKNKAEK